MINEKWKRSIMIFVITTTLTVLATWALLKIRGLA